MKFEEKFKKFWGYYGTSNWNLIVIFIFNIGGAFALIHLVEKGELNVVLILIILFQWLHRLDSDLDAFMLRCSKKEDKEDKEDLEDSITVGSVVEITSLYTSQKKKLFSRSINPESLVGIKFYVLKISKTTGEYTLSLPLTLEFYLPDFSFTKDQLKVINA